ncbi:MAG: hypothetical protein LBS85_08220 [Clostridiales Family XIII bacterium]|jgi:hypothetical protein|nr:hypothetical protein [Clostridiales Family XIII bacterium]
METIIILVIGAALSLGILLAVLPAASYKAALRLPHHRRAGALSEWKRETAARFKTALPSSRRRERVDRELFTALGILRNYASVSSGARKTTDAILEQFAGGEGLLRESFAGALRLLRTGRAEEAAAYFTAAANTEMARDFIMLLLEWDQIAPARLKQTIDSFRCAMKEQRTTELLRKTEIMSDIVYLPVVACVLVVFMNFIFVAYFIEQKDLLMELFY